MNQTTVELAVAEAILGKDAEEFLESELGRYLAGRAKQEADAATAELKRCNPKDAEAIARLQGVIERYESFDEWLKELIVSGRVAKNNLEIIRNEQEI